MARASVEDPLKVFRYRVIIDGFVRMGFSEVTGVSRDTDTVEYREGGMQETPQISAGLTKYNPVVLKRGQIVGSTRGGDDDIINWVQQVHEVGFQGTASNYRKDFDLEQYSSVNTKVRVWTFRNAFPKTFMPFSDQSGNASENSYESVTIVHEGFELIL